MKLINAVYIFYLKGILFTGELLACWTLLLARIGEQCGVRHLPRRCDRASFNHLRRQRCSVSSTAARTFSSQTKQRTCRCGLRDCEVGVSWYSYHRQQWKAPKSCDDECHKEEAITSVARTFFPERIRIFRWLLLIHNCGLRSHRLTQSTFRNRFIVHIQPHYSLRGRIRSHHVFGIFSKYNI